MIEWLVRLLNVFCDQHGTSRLVEYIYSTVPLYEDKGDKYDCTGFRGTGLTGVKSFYVNHRTCVRVGNSVSDWFHV